MLGNNFRDIDFLIAKHLFLWASSHFVLFLYFCNFIFLPGKLRSAFKCQASYENFDENCYLAVALSASNIAKNPI